VSDESADDIGRSLAAVAAILGVGSRVSKYRLEEQIGQGGMAVVYRALDERLGRQVALNVLAPALAADEGFRHRFLGESRKAAAVNDPHITPVYEADDAGGVLFIAMQYVPGGDVRTLLHREKGWLPAARAAAIVSPVASALDATGRPGWSTAMSRRRTCWWTSVLTGRIMSTCRTSV
jgi:serine/threonine protein kinase